MLSVILMLLSPAHFANAGTSTADKREIAVLPFELHDLTLNPDTVGESERTATLQPLLQAKLKAHNIHVVENPPSAVTEAAKGAGYLFDRPSVSAQIGREAAVDWIVSGRLHKASFLFVYLKSQLINTKTGAVSADFVVEIKGPQKKLTHKGVETLARQIAEALQTLAPMP